MPNSRQRNVSYDRKGCLWQSNDRRSVTQVTILDALTRGPVPIPAVTEFHCSDGALGAMFALHQEVDFPAFIPQQGLQVQTSVNAPTVPTACLFTSLSRI